MQRRDSYPKAEPPLQLNIARIQANPQAGNIAVNERRFVSPSVTRITSRFAVLKVVFLYWLREVMDVN